MSYADAGDDELDYGEGELGDGHAAGVSLGAPADDDEMAQEDEYEELYDDVNIGFLEAPASAAGDAHVIGQSDMAEGKPNLSAMTEDLYAADMEQSQVRRRSGVPAAEVLAEGSMGVKTELEEEIKDGRESSAMWSAQMLNTRQHIDILGNGKGTEQGGQMPSLLSPTAKLQGADHSNGLMQSSARRADKFYPAYIAKTDLAAENPAASPGSLAQSGAHPVSSLGAGAGRVTGGVSESFKDPGGADEILYGRNAGLATGPPRPSQRDLSYSVADNSSRQQMVNDETVRQQQYSAGDGGGMLFVGDLQWWTTDAEMEAALSEYGPVKNLKFYEERVSGKSKGYCQVEFYNHASAAACKQGMNGRKFHGRPCIVALGNAKGIQQMGHQQERKTQAQFQAQQEQMNSRRANNNSTGGTRSGSSYQDREGGRGYGRARSGQGLGSKTGPGGGGRGRGNYTNKGIGGGGSGSGGSGIPYGQGHSGPMGGHQPAMMIHQGMIGQGYDHTYGPMGGRAAAAYGGYLMPGPPFPGMVASFPGMGPGALPGVAPHVNPAFFGRPNGMGLMPGSGMEGPHQAMWGEGAMGGWVDEHDRRARDGTFAEDGVNIDYNYNGDLGQEKGKTMGAWDRGNGGFPDRHRRDDRDGEWERGPYKERDRDVYRDQRDRDRYHEKADDWDRERAVKNRNKSWFVDEDDDPRLRSKDGDYGRKRKMSDRELSNI